MYEDVVRFANEGLSAYEDSKFEKAVWQFSIALRQASELNQPRITAVLFNRMGRALDSLGLIQDSVKAYESGFKALDPDPDFDVQEALMSLQSVSKEIIHARDLDSPDLYSEALARELDEAQSDPTLPVKLLINIGNAYLRQPVEDPALNAYQQALARPEINEAPILRGHVLTHIGAIKRRRKQIDEAEHGLQEALSLLEAHAEPVEKRRALAILASIYRDQGNAERALETYNDALTLYRQVEDPLGEGRTLAGLGILYLGSERIDEAKEAFESAAKLAEDQGDKDTLWSALWGLGRCQHAMGDLENAATSLRRSLNLVQDRQWVLRTDEGKVSFIESVQDVFTQLISVHLERATTQPSAYKDALKVAEQARGRALNDLMRGRRRQRPYKEMKYRTSRFRPFESRRIPLDQETIGYFSPPPGFHPAAQMAPSFPSDFDIHLDAPLPDDLFEGGGEQAVAIDSPSPRDLVVDEEIADVDEPVEIPEPPPLARLVFHVLADRTAVFTVTPPGEVHGHIIEVGEQELVERVAQLRSALRVDDEPRSMDVLRHARPAGTDDMPSDPEPLLQDFYSTFIEPVAEKLPEEGMPLVIEPHGALWMLPFSALLAPDGSWLADKWPLLYSPSNQTLNEIRHDPDYGGPNDLKALVIGDPSMPKVPDQEGLELQLGSLPGAKKEARAIAKMFPKKRRTLWLGSKAKRSALEEHAAEYGILHLATHGIAYSEDPLKSFIALAESEDKDGLLTARDVMYMSLPADLVTLSACQTGLGRISGDGMIGLSRAFLVAGARSVLVSQWSVSDQATAELMTAFYRSFIELDDKAIALQRAMQEVRSKSKYEHPRYWAAFLVFGAEA
jgi:CHAT domain-containing protein/tetratricopeptide (TPR) repeat protein